MGIIYQERRKRSLRVLLCLMIFWGVLSTCILDISAQENTQDLNAFEDFRGGDTSNGPAVSSEPESPDEAGYYLVHDDFTMISANSYSQQGYSSWDVANVTSIPVSSSGVCYIDNSKYAEAHMQRQFNEISEDFVWEFTLKANTGTLKGTVVDMRYQDTIAVRFIMESGKLKAVTPDEIVEICELNGSRFTGLKVKVSPSKGTYMVMADGNTAARELRFLNMCNTIDRMYIQTTEEATGAIYLSTVRIYTGYYINEKFLNADKGTVPDEWTITGATATAYKTGTQGPDKYSATMSNGATMSRELSYNQDGIWLEYQLLIPESVDEFAMVLEDTEGNTFKVSTKNGKFGYYNIEGNFVELYDCLANMWYHIMLKQTDKGGLLYLNHKLKEDNIEISSSKFTKLSFIAGNGQVYLDDIVLKDWIPYPKDYVEEPVAVEKSEGDILVGLQSCNLWVEGTHFGYDWLTQWDERTPYLGYYDETIVETADWELKWKVEHGIDYELFCWYRPQGSNDQPIKTCRNGTALHEGYFNARYSDLMKFAITWECAGGPVSGSH